MIITHGTTAEATGPLAIKLNRHLIPVALTTIVALGAICLLVASRRFGVTHVGRVQISTVRAHRVAKALLAWGVITAPFAWAKWGVVVGNKACAKHPHPPTHVWNSTPKVWRWIKDVGSTLITPIVMKQLIHTAVGMPILYTDFHGRNRRNTIPNNCKRLSIEMDGTRIDGVIRPHRESTSWVVISLGATGCYENHIDRLLALSGNYQANVIIYNPPGCGSSTGLPTRTNLVNGYRAVFDYIHTQSPTHVISFGFSLGGIAQNEAYPKLSLHNDVNYTWIKDSSPLTMQEGAIGMMRDQTGGAVGTFAFRWFSGWSSMRSVPKQPRVVGGNEKEIFIHSDQQNDELLEWEQSAAYVANQRGATVIRRAGAHWEPYLLVSDEHWRRDR